MKDFSRQMIQRGVRHFVVDLKECEMMDSTFMGALAGVALRLREIGQGEVKAINVNDRNTDLLSNLGLDRLIEVRSSPDNNMQTPEMVPAASTATASKEDILNAHETLVEIDKRNAVRFKDVLDYLRQDLNAEGGEN